MNGLNTTDLVVRQVEKPDEKSRVCGDILRSLPEWFGIPEAVTAYIDEVRGMDTWVAGLNGKTCGFISISRPNEFTAEIHVMGILPEWHGKGIGSELLSRAEAALIAANYRFLQVKTLSPSRENEEYARTRKFYLKNGFCPVEEFKTLWGEANPCLQMIKSLADRRGVHHIEIYVSDLQKSVEFWSWLLCGKLGYSLFQEWEQGRSYILDSSYICFVQAERKFLGQPFHRCRPGLNHLAFKAVSKEQIDELTCELEQRGCRILYRDQHPHAGGNAYAVFFEDPERIKVELTV